MNQPSLFDAVASAYGNHDVLDNAVLYHQVASATSIAIHELERKVPVGNNGQHHSLLKRSIRWHQQTLKHEGLIERVPGERGLWQLTAEGKNKLRRVKPNVAMIAFSTDLGVAIWGNCEHVYSMLDIPISLCLSSPPYPLRKPRSYGNPTEAEYVDFICRSLEPIVKNMLPGANVALNVSNDIFVPGSPERPMYLERMLLALHDRLGLKLMERMIWENRSKPPGPIAWASKKRVHLNVAYEPIYILSNNPNLSRASNLRVLEPHTKKHIKLIFGGGEHREAEYGDGAYSIRHGSFSNDTPGRIPKNVLQCGSNCKDMRQYREDARRLGLPIHGAMMPSRVTDFLIKFLTDVGEVVADPFGGKLTTAKSAQRNNRRWVTTECMWEYMRGGAESFVGYDGFQFNGDFLSSMKSNMAV